jgi:hypothetical protein
MTIPTHSIFENEVYGQLAPDEKNLLFYWSLIDNSSWEEVPPPYFPDATKGHEKVIQILKRSPQIKNIIAKDADYFLKRFIQGEFLANYLLACELESKLNNSWVLDVANLQKTDPPDVVFKKSEAIVSLEIKGMLSAANLKERIVTEVKPYLGNKNYDNFLLLLLFPVCPRENPSRVNQLIEGYYIYEEIIKDDKKRRQVFCQCFTESKRRGNGFTLDNLAERIVKKYFEKLEIV